jgi:hypothetical protein
MLFFIYAVIGMQVNLSVQQYLWILRSI